MADKKDTKLTDEGMTEIDRALAAARARKATKAAAGTTEEKAPRAPKAPKAATEPKRPRLTEEQKAQRQAAAEAARTARSAARAEARAAKLAERNASRQPAHMRKVQKAAERLGALGSAAQLLFNEATANLTGAELATFAAHIQHHNRVQATQRALGQKIEAGMQVGIVGGDPRFIGKSGTVTKAQRIRCYVQVEGVAKPIYLFTSDVQASEAPAVAAAG